MGMGRGRDKTGWCGMEQWGWGRRLGHAEKEGLNDSHVKPKELV